GKSSHPEASPLRILDTAQGVNSRHSSVLSAEFLADRIGLDCWKSLTRTSGHRSFLVHVRNVYWVADRARRLNSARYARVFFVHRKYGQARSGRPTTKKLYRPRSILCSSGRSVA